MTPTRRSVPSTAPSGLPTPFRGPLQWDVLKALMGGQRLTARQVERAVNSSRPSRLAYTTVRTSLERLVERGVVRRERRGTVILYASRAREAEMVDELLSVVIDGVAAFGPGALAALRDRLDRRLREDPVAS